MRTLANIQCFVAVLAVQVIFVRSFTCPTVCYPCENMTEVCPLPRLWSDDYQDACNCCPLCVTLVDEDDVCDQCEQSSESFYQWIRPTRQCKPGLYCLCKSIPETTVDASNAESTTLSIAPTLDPSEQRLGKCRQVSDVPADFSVTPNYPKWPQTSAPLTSTTSTSAPSTSEAGLANSRKNCLLLFAYHCQAAHDNEVK